MSKNKGHAEFSKYDDMSSQELQEILYKHAHDELQIQMDTEELFYIMEVLVDRKNKTPEQEAKEIQEAFVTFRKHYMPKKNKMTPFVRGVIRCAAVFAVVVVVLFAASTSVDASALNIWDKFAVWTKEFFSFSDGTQETQPTEPDVTDPVVYSELQKALNEYGIQEKLAPTCLPDGYIYKDILVMDSPKERSIQTIYEKDGTELIIYIRQLIGGSPLQVEKNEHLLEVYTVEGVDYYLFSNNTTVQAAWVVGEFECIIGGKVTVGEMKAMIDSI